MTHRFQVDLRGIIDLLSQNLYSGPHVFVRELLQNCVDAIRARERVDPSTVGAIDIEVGSNPDDPTLIFRDNGIGLTEDEIHRFLATIGQSSKRQDISDQRNDFIGQFGIGLLSCFMVSDDIVVCTQPASGAPGSMWRGRPDGTYSIEPLAQPIGVGSEVRLRGKKQFANYFEIGRVRELAAYYGSFLPYPITVHQSNERHCVNDVAPWGLADVESEDTRETVLEFGRRFFGVDFLDYVPISSPVGGVDGIAFILPHSPAPTARGRHRVYLKGMLLSESAENLLPDWAFFVRCLVNADDLRPTASRESFYEDEKLDHTRSALGAALRTHLVNLARNNPRKLERFVVVHSLSIKALAVHDPEFLRLFADWLPFETSLGTMTLGEYRRNHPIVRFTANLDQFRQIARVAAAQRLCVLNGAYVYDADLLSKLPDVFPGTFVEHVDATSLAQEFEELSLAERDESHTLRLAADRALAPFGCSVEVKKFAPGDLPALYSASHEASFLRSAEQAKDVSSDLWASVLDSVADRASSHAEASLCLNLNNALVRKLCSVTDGEVAELAVRLLYVQSLLLGHHPLSSQELSVLNTGLIRLIELGVDFHGGFVS